MILITGATGFIGSELCARMVKKHGAESVFLLQRRVPHVENSILALRFKEHGLDLKVHSPKVILADFSNFEDLKEKLSELGARTKKWTLFHLAAMIDKKRLNRKEQKKINVDLSMLLVNWANEHATRFIYTSSVAAYGLSTNKKIRNEENYWDFHWVSNLIPYYRTKRRAHELVLAHLKIPYSVFCPSVVHGSLEFSKESRLHIKGMVEKNFKVFPPGGANFVSLDLVASALENAETNKNAESVVQLLVDKNWSLLEYVNYWKKVAGAKTVAPFILPSLFFWIAAFLYLPLVYFFRVKALESVLGTFSFFYFESKRVLPKADSVEEAIVDAFQSGSKKTLQY